MSIEFEDDGKDFIMIAKSKDVPLKTMLLNILACAYSSHDQYGSLRDYECAEY